MQRLRQLAENMGLCYSASSLYTLHACVAPVDQLILYIIMGVYIYKYICIEFGNWSVGIGIIQGVLICFDKELEIEGIVLVLVVLGSR